MGIWGLLWTTGLHGMAWQLRLCSMDHTHCTATHAPGVGCCLVSRRQGLCRLNELSGLTLVKRGTRLSKDVPSAAAARSCTCQQVDTNLK